MTEFVRFGSPQAFELAVRWSPDREPRERLPQDHGWSTGDIRITVGHVVLTKHEFRGKSRNHLSWYLSPLMDWLLTHWSWLFHEEAFNWPDRSGAPAAAATFAAMKRYIASDDAVERERYEEIQRWWRRHALRAADSSALYPDIYLRRSGDDIEVSWLDRQPSYAPGNFRLTLLPGYATLPVADVAEPLWQFLQWGLDTAQVARSADLKSVELFRARFEALRRTPVSELELQHVGTSVQAVLRQARQRVDWTYDGKASVHAPVAVALDSPVLMFGGLNVNIGAADADRLLGFLAGQRGDSQAPELDGLTGEPGPQSWMQAHEEGYELALDAREALGIAHDELFVDIRGNLEKLGVHVREQSLAMEHIRGVAVAGRGFRPAILVNLSSAYNNAEPGKRFTLAHELCHILHDRTHARRLSHVSGPWASARVEKRANAFAMMFLASTSALRSLHIDADPVRIREIANQMGVGYSALVEHLYNTDLLGDAERERVRLH